MTARGRTRDRGFTLIETVVVVSIIGLLAMLTMAGVVHSREAARNLQCKNNLRQIGVALNAHETQYHAFPSALPYRRYRMARTIEQKVAVSGDPSGLLELLPFLDQQSLANQLFFGKSPFRLTMRDRMNQTLAATRLNVLICPSDVSSGGPWNGPVSYRFNIGAKVFRWLRGDALLVEPANGDYLGAKAAFTTPSTLAPGDFTDGLSQTVGLSERVIGSHETLDRRRDLGFLNVSHLIPIHEASQIVDLCSRANGVPSTVMTTLGRTWTEGNYENTWYNHILPPNSRVMDCSTEVSHVGMLNSTAVSARSRHSSGVNALRMDGSCSFARESISLAVWRALGTRSRSDEVR